MIKINGTVVRDSVNSVKAQYGDQAYQTILGLLGGETRALFEKPIILPSSWYSLDAFVEFLEMDLRVTARGNEQELIKRSEAIIERQLSGIYKMFVKLSSPEFLLNRISSIHQSYFQGVAIEVSLPSAGKAILKYTGFAKQHRLIGLSIIGFYRKALEISGAREVTATYSTAIEANKGYCELILGWSGK